jgi:hypothetical protein
MNSVSTVVIALTLLTGCTPRNVAVAPVGPGSECGVDLVNRTGDLVEVWYEPGHVQLGIVARDEVIVFEARCESRVLRIYGRRVNPLADTEGLGCSSTEARLRSGETVMASLNAPRVGFSC